MNHHTTTEAMRIEVKSILNISLKTGKAVRLN